MTIVVPFVFGLGVFLVFDGLTRRRAERTGVRRPSWVRSWLGRNGLAHVAPASFIGASAAIGVAAGLVVVALVGSAAVGVVATLAGAGLPVVVARRRARATRSERQRSWPDAIDLLAGAVRSGDTLPAAIAVVAERGPAGLRADFDRVLGDHRITGDLVGALERMATMLGDPVADRVVATLVLAQRVGGRELGRVLRTLAVFVREDLAARREIEARQSWIVVAARVAAAAPWAVLLLVASRPEGAAAFDSSAGLTVLLTGAGLTAVGYRSMLRIGRLPEPPRVAGAAS